MNLLVFLTGLIFGSFYNVVALRSLTGEKTSFPPSHCTSCSHKLSPLDLVPVFSWIFLRGRCRYCKEKISYIYPVGEILTGVAFLLVYTTYGFTLNALIHLVLVSVLAIATTSDLKDMMVQDRFYISGLALILPLRIFSSEPAIPYILSSLGIFAIFLALFFFSQGRLGGADVKLYALIGLALGVFPTAASTFYSSLIALVIFLPLMLLKKWDRKKPIPYVPFMMLGVLAYYAIGMGLFQV